MTEKIFIGGSKTIRELSPAMKSALIRVRNEKMSVLVGDCFGADRLIQEYLLRLCHKDVTVFASGERVRNNVGSFDVRHIDAGGKTGFEFYRQKDIAMADEADLALMFWDGRTRGTLCNIRDMEERGKLGGVIVRG